MANPITWQNIDAPNITAVTQALQAAQRGIGSGIGQLGTTVQGIQDLQEQSRLGRREYGAQDFITKLADTYKTPEALAEASAPGGAIDQLKASYGTNIDPIKARNAAADLLTQRYGEARTANAYKDETQQRMDRPLVGKIVELSSSFDPADRKKASDLLQSRPDLVNYPELAKSLGESQHKDVLNSYAAAREEREKVASQLAVKAQQDTADFHKKSLENAAKQLGLTERGQLFQEGRSLNDDIRQLYSTLKDSTPQTINTREGATEAASFLAKNPNIAVSEAFNAALKKYPNAPVGILIAAASRAIPAGSWDITNWRTDAAKKKAALETADIVVSGLPDNKETRKRIKDELDILNSKRDQIDNYLNKGPSAPRGENTKETTVPNPFDNTQETSGTNLQTNPIAPNTPTTDANKLANQLAFLQANTKIPGSQSPVRVPGGLGDIMASRGTLLPDATDYANFQRTISDQIAARAAAEKAAASKGTQNAKSSKEVEKAKADAAVAEFKKNLKKLQENRSSIY